MSQLTKQKTITKNNKIDKMGQINNRTTDLYILLNFLKIIVLIYLYSYALPSTTLSKFGVPLAPMPESLGWQMIVNTMETKQKQKNNKIDKVGQINNRTTDLYISWCRLVI